MGADISPPQLLPHRPKRKKTAPVIIAGALLLVVCALKWRDVIEYINGEPRLNQSTKNGYKRN